MSNTFVHIGVPKTGSTAIQRFATDNRVRLRALGVLYPETALRGFGHHDLAFLLDGGYPEWATPQNEPLEAFATALAAECEGFDGDVLLSSEDFYLVPQPAALAQLLHDVGLTADRNLQIVVYLRRQDDLLVSWYNQMVKAQGFTGTFTEALQTSTWMGEYDTQLARWADAFGAERLVVRRYPSDRLLEDFWSLVCPAAVPEIAATAPVNTRLTRDLLEIQRIINRLPVPIVEKRRFHHDLMTLAAEDRWSLRDAPVADAAELDDLLARYSSGNDAVAATYFDGGPLFPEPGPRPDAAYAGLDIDTVVSVLGWLLLRR